MTKQEEWCEKIRAIFHQKAASDKRIQAILQRVESGKATFTDTAAYSRMLSELLGRVLSEYLGDETTAYVKEYVCREMLRDRYESMNDVLASVQRALDEKAGLRIAPQRAAFPAERVNAVAHALEDPTVPMEVIKRRAKAPVANVANSFHDDYVKENAKFRSKAGLRCYIVRQTDGKCCEWCTAMAGRYVYGEEPQEVYRRHDNCGCTVVYECGRQRQDVWSKKTWEVADRPKKTRTPVRMDYKQGKALENAKLSGYRGLTSGRNGGIITIGRQIERRERNIGAFSSLQIPMQKKEVLQLCAKYGIDTTGLTFKIQRSEKMLALPFYGSTDYNNIGRIDLFPNAFIDEEQLIKTVLHEKCHVLQLKKYGKAYVQSRLTEMEMVAYRFEEMYYAIVSKKMG